jgi:small-conductance mechanosensitive channel
MKANVKVVVLSIIIFFLLFGVPIPTQYQFICSSCTPFWTAYFLGGINHGQYLWNFTNPTTLINSIFLLLEFIIIIIVSYFVSDFIVKKLSKKKK